MNGDPVGTFFVIQEGTAGWWGESLSTNTVRWMATTRHTIEHYEHVTARMSSVRGGPPAEWDVNEWRFPEGGSLTELDPCWDIAIAPFEPRSHLGAPLSKHDYAALPTLLKVIRKQLELGRPVYLAGLLPWENRKDRDTHAVVRSATLASRDEPNMSWDDDGRWWKADTVDLIDTRADHGASGSPTFVQFYIYGGPKSARWTEWSPTWDKIALLSGKSEEEVEALGPVETFTHWHGMYAAWDERRRIGITISAEDIAGFITSDEMADLRAHEVQKVEDLDSEA